MVEIKSQKIMSHFLKILILFSLTTIASAESQKVLFSIVKDSFSVSSSADRTVKVTKPEEFPRQIAPAQRIAVFLPEIESNNLLFSAGIELKEKYGLLEPQSLNILFNKHLLFRAMIKKNVIRVVIPYSYLEKGENILEIINLSLLPITFSSVKVEQYCIDTPASAEDRNTVKSAQFIKKLTSTAREFTMLGLSFKAELPGTIAQEIAGFIQNEHFIFSFQELIKDESFFDPVSGKPIESYCMIKRIAPFFEGTPQVLECDLFPLDEYNFLNNAKWTAVKNADGIYTVLVSGNYENGKNVRLMLPLEKETESFKLRYSVSSEIPKQNEKLEWKEAEVSDGILKCDFQLSDCTVIRFVKDGAKEPEKIKFTDEKNKTVPIFRKDILKVTDKQIKPDLIRTPVYWPCCKGISGPAYSEKEIDATPSTFDGVKNIVPWDKKSILVEIAFKEGDKDNYGGATIYLGTGPASMEEFSFWVYPRAANNIKKTTLQFYMPSVSKPEYFLAVDIVTDKWQRVTLPYDKINPLSYGNFCVVGNPKLPEYAKGAKVSFEFNGLCVSGDTHMKFGKCGLETARIIIKDKNELYFIFTGKPNSYFEYRYQFKEPSELTAALELSGYKGLNYIYRKDAQLLEINGKFPEYRKTEASDKQLPEANDEKSKSTLSDEVKKNCTPEEIAKYEKGESSILVVKLTVKD